MMVSLHGRAESLSVRVQPSPSSTSTPSTRPAPSPPASQAQGGLLAMVAVLVLMLGLYLARFRAEFWARPRMLALLGILIVLAAASVRATAAIEPNTSWYVLPAVAFGFMTAVLFDARIAVLMALSVGVLAAVGTGDVGITVYATLATLAPIPFVSSVSTRGAFRNAVVLSSLTAAVVAAATSWFFHVGPKMPPLEVIGLLGGLGLRGVGDGLADRPRRPPVLRVGLRHHHDPGPARPDRPQPRRSPTPPGEGVRDLQPLADGGNARRRRGTCDRGQRPAGSGHGLLPRPGQDREPHLLHREPVRDSQPPRPAHPRGVGGR